VITKNCDLAVVMPVYNEETNIEQVVVEWASEFERLGIAFNMIAVNDGSQDQTGAVLKTLAQRYPGSFTPVEKANAGHGRACRTGYELAVEQGASWTLQIDSDGQCDPAFFPAFWNGRTDADAVFGVRKTRDDGFARVLISAICRWGASLLTGIDLHDANVPYRLIRTSALKEALDRIPDDFDMQNVALTVVLKRDSSLRWKYVPIHFRNRQGGVNSINLRRIAAMGWNLFSEIRHIRN
jgi:dolichol-phosphate mannosyltransferase